MTAEEVPEEECPLCDVIDRFCDYLPEDKRQLCRDLAEKIKKGEIGGKEARDILVREVGMEKVAEATKALAEYLSSKFGQSEQAQE
jgi:hypothetical protein